ncbi:IPT/TIG domain-containing protein [Oleiharenicola sp. Vm1]|uniref:IPT/TIG domain-containing protein n=1 Tax=Oleiharenicola sp. Vm1 TaxID=3398393 RepID=UPI0039F5312D
MQLLSSRFRRLAALVSASGALWLLTGCQVMTITNMTPDNVPANPSQIYTITATFKPASFSIDEASIKPRIVIDGQIYPMTKSSAAELWEFDYQLPAGRTNANYYFIVSYLGKDAPPGAIPTEAHSELQHMSIAGRYVLRPEAGRAPVGARVSVLGAGFTPNDVVYFDNQPTRTVFESPSSISFFVPAVATGKSYTLRVAGGGTALAVGSFRVDAINFTVSPSALTLRAGEQQAMTFTIPQPAPAGGMLIDVQTDAPESIIMPEVIVPAGQTSVTIAVQGGKPGTGSLFFKSSAGESSVPVTVTK